MITAYFDSLAFYRDIDTLRQQRNLRWHSIFSETGITRETFRHMKQGDNIHANTLATLALYAHLDIYRYFMVLSDPAVSQATWPDFSADLPFVSATTTS